MKYIIKTGDELDIEKDGNNDLKNKYRKSMKKFVEALEKRQKIKMGNKTLVIVNFSSDQNEFDEIVELISKGESGYVEFKSTLRWDMRKNCVNKELEHAIVKEISGFLNTEGGVLLIGVSDDGKILGLKKDYKSLGKKDKDGFQLKLVEIVSNHIANEFVDYWRIKFLSVENKEICVVEVDKSPEPVYTKRRNMKDKDFFIRKGSSTRPLSRSEMV